jgi:PAS domain S-box-containing protein/putative nucleotidyltransferase with HDIG domain
MSQRIEKYLNELLEYYNNLKRINLPNIQNRPAEELLKILQLQENLIPDKDNHQYLKILDEQDDLICTFLPDTTLTFVNVAYCKYFGLDRDSLIGTKFLKLIPEEEHEYVKRNIASITKENPIKIYEHKVIKPNGGIFWQQWTDKGIFDSDGNIIAYHSTGHDITKLKQIEESLVQSRNEMYRKLKNIEEQHHIIMETIPSPIFIFDENRFLYVNRATETWSLYNEKELLSMHLFDLILPEHQIVLKKEINKMSSDKAANFELKYLTKTNKLGWILLTLNTINLEDNFKAWIGIVNEITFRKKATEKIKRSYFKMRETLNQTVAALASTVELRDNYTASHQKQVSNLATTIARELGLSKYKIDGIRVASLLHDIGKISIPLDILSKTKELKKIEFDLIKSHVIEGYNIIKNIDFLWRVADIVYQHHERINGTGYPQGLIGDQILIEAKILAVADVVEAMTSHRPYRPSLGIDAALHEISQNSGILYDPLIAHTCIKLFRDKNFRFD